MGVETALILGAAAAAAGTGYSANQQHEAGNTAKRAAGRERDRIAGIEREKTGNIDRVRESYGIGTTTTAQQNQQRLADYLQNYYKDNLTSNLRSVDNQYATASRTSRQNLARVGQLDSGLDASSKSSTLADFLRGRQDAIAKAASARDGLSGRLAGQRQNFETSISTGQANPDINSISAQQQSLLDSAKSSIPANAVAQGFNVAGSTYFNGRQQEANGNQGLQAFGFSGSNGGRIS